MNLANVETILNSLLTQQKFLSSKDVKLNEIMEIVKNLSLDNVTTKNEPHMSTIKIMLPKMSLMSILKISNQINVQVWLVFSRILL